VSRAQVAYVDGAVAVSDTQQHAWQYIPATGTWTSEPALPTDTVASSIVAIDGSTVAVAVTSDGELTASRNDNGTWTPLVDPTKTSIQQPIAVNGGGSLIVVDSAGQATPVRVDDSTHTWAPLAGYPLAPGATTTPVWATTGLFVWGGLPAGTTIPPPLGPTTPTPNSPEAAWYAP
jgi:hypothetical protein